MDLNVLLEFLDAKPILQCLWLSSFSPFSSTCTFTVLELFSYCHQLLSYVFSNENSIMQYLNLGKAVLRPPFQASLSGSTWYRVCLHLILLLRWSHYRLDVYSLPLCQAFLCIASARLFSVFSVFASSGHFCYAFCWLAMQSCSLVVCACWVHWVPRVCSAWS